MPYSCLAACSIRPPNLFFFVARPHNFSPCVDRNELHGSIIPAFRLITFLFREPLLQLNYLRWDAAGVRFGRNGFGNRSRPGKRQGVIAPRPLLTLCGIEKSSVLHRGDRICCYELLAQRATCTIARGENWNDLYRAGGTFKCDRRFRIVPDFGLAVAVTDADGRMCLMCERRAQMRTIDLCDRTAAADGG